MIERLFYTEAEAAAMVAIDQKTLAAHARAGHVRFMLIGFGKRRQRRRYTLEDLQELRANLGRLQCPSTAPGKRTAGSRNSGATTSPSTVFDFAAARRQRIAARRSASRLKSATESC